MLPATRAAHNIEITAESLQEDLARLQVQKRALERELAAVVAHLDSVQRALGALSALMTDSAAVEQAAASFKSGQLDTEPVDAHSPSPVEEHSGSPAPRSTGGRKRRTSRAKTAEQQYGKLTEQILDYFTHLPETEVRARDVAAALGRDTDSGSINAIRSTLDRLVGTSRIERAGRGLYRAK